MSISVRNAATATLFATVIITATFTTAASYANSQTPQQTKQHQLSSEAVPEETLTHHATTALHVYKQQLTNAKTAVADNTVTNPNLDSIRAELTTEADNKLNQITNLITGTLSFPTLMLTTKDIDNYVTTNLTHINQLTEAYKTELSAEKQRIAEAEAAAQAEAEANARNQYVPRAGETQEARLARIASEVGVTVPVNIREGCGGLANVLACFSQLENAITVTQLGLSQTDQKLRCSLTHENRHAWQYATGFLDMLPDETPEAWRERAESDARTNGCG